MPPKERPEEQRGGTGAAVATGAGAAGAGTGAAVAPAPTGAVVGAAAIAETTAVVLAALRAFWGKNEDFIWLYQSLARRHPELTVDELTKLAQLESAYGQEFRRRMAARLERDIPVALAGADPKAALRKLLEREKRYINQRQQAMIARSIATIERDSLKRISPEGAYWRLSPFVKEHTIDCIAMGGKFWPWEVLDIIHPPRHAGCPCELYGLAEAIHRGFLPFGFAPPDPGEGMELARELQLRFKELREALQSDDDLAAVIEEIEELRLQETAWAKRFAKGTEKGGEFMPKRGGFSARLRTDLARSFDGLMRVGSGRGRTRPQRAPSEPKPGKDTPGMVGTGPRPKPRPAAEGTDGKPPKSFEEFKGRVSAGASATAEANHARLVFKGIDHDPEEPDTTALRWWDGHAAIGADAPGHLEAGAAAQEGESDPKAASGTWLTYSRSAHEAVGHGVNPIKPAEYETPEGYALEEALAEEVGREEAAAWLAQDGHTDALAWAKANPTHPRALGPYTIERARLATLLDAAGVPPEARRGLVRTMSLRQGHQARLNLLAGLVANGAGLEPSAAAEMVRARLAGEHDEELGINGIEAEAHLPVTGDLAEAEVPGEGGSAAGGREKASEPRQSASGGVSSPPKPSPGAGSLVDVSGPRGFDARHYSDPRRSLLAKMRALPDGETLELADGSKIKRGPKGSFRITRPGGKGQLYSTPQRLANAETAGILERHGVGGARLKAARKFPGVQSSVQRAPEEPTGIQKSVEAVAVAAREASTDEKKWVTVVVDDEDNATVVGAYAQRTTANAQATKNQDATIRAYVAAPTANGGMVVMSGPVVIGTSAPPQRAPAETEPKANPGTKTDQIAGDINDRSTISEAPPAEITGIPAYSAAEVGLKDFKAAGGSNGAQFAKDANGDPWLVKAYRGNTDRVATELLANAVYRELGVDVPEAGQMGSGPDFSAVPDEPIDEPPLPKVPKGKEQSTGMVVLEDDGSMWVFEPKDHFGGYEHTFSKGRLEKGLSPQQNARKELWEELGMRANPVAVLGDYEGDKTMTRYFVARRTNEPSEPTGGETAPEGVRRVSPEQASEMLNKERDQGVLKDVLAHEWPAGDRTDHEPPEGAPQLAYPLVDGKTEQWEGESQELGEGFMADALMGNWDVVGLQQDNVLWADGRPVRVDQGGTFEFRAMGEPKPFGPVPTEVWTMRSPKGQAFGRMALSEEMMKDQARDISERLTPQRIDQLVDETPFADGEMRDRVRENLKARVTFMRGIADGTEELPGPLRGPEADRQLARDLERVAPLYPEEERALTHLLDEGDDIDAHLRSGRPKEEAPLPVQGSVEQLDGLLEQARAGEDFTTYLPVSFEALGAVGDALAGKRFREASYLTASTDEAAAKAAGKAVLRLLVPAGTHVVGAADLSTEPGAVVFRRGTQIRIAGAAEEDGTVFIDAVAS